MSRAAYALRRIEHAITVFKLTADSRELAQTVQQIIDRYQAGRSDL